MQLPVAGTFLKMLTDRESVIRTLLRDMLVSQKNMEGFERLEDLFEKGADVSTEKVLRNAAKSLRHLNAVNTRITLLLLVYVVGDYFLADAAKVAMKFGAGDDALKAMMQAKFGGKF